MPVLQHPLRFPYDAIVATLNILDMTPAEKVIAAFRGVRKTARAVNRNPSSVSRWTKPREAGGLGGRVPAGVHRAILLASAEHDLGITAADLIGND